MIDVGGPSMLRAAAKNFAHVAPVCRPEQYEPVLDELRVDRAALARTRADMLADEAFATTAAYDAAIATWFAETELFPRAAHAQLPEGRRPRVRREPAPARRVLRRGRCAPAPALARRAARRQGALVQQPRRPRGRAPRRARVHAAGRVIVKHGEPVRRRRRAARSRRRTSCALAADPVSAFGCVLVLNRPVGRSARRSGSRSTSSRCCSRPSFDDEALAALRGKPALACSRSRAPRRRRRASATTSACSAACSCRSATSTSTTAS